MSNVIKPWYNSAKKGERIHINAHTSGCLGSWVIDLPQTPKRHTQICQIEN